MQNEITDIIKESSGNNHGTTPYKEEDGVTDREIVSAPLDDIEEYAEILSDLPEEKKAKVERLIFRKVESFSGPIPHPDMLKKYDTVLPGCAERMVSMVEREQQNRFANDSTTRDVKKADIRFRANGQVFAMFVMFALTAAGITLCFLGNNIGAGILLSMPVTRLLISFFRKEYNPTKEEHDQESSAEG